MTLLQELNQIKLFLICGLDKEMIAEAYVNVLKKHNSLYHFDELTKDIPAFDVYPREERRLIDELTGVFYECDKLWSRTLEILEE